MTAHARLAAAHRELLSDGTTQFDLRFADPPAETPEWVKALGRALASFFDPVGRFFGRLFGLLPNLPYGRIFIWSLVAILAAIVLWMVFQRLRTGEWQWPQRRRVVEVAETVEETWRPAAAPARKLLAEADALAEAGHYAEAVHLLLRRSLQDIARRRPRLLRPALTSREIANAAALPMSARETFAAIARIVERSLFGGSAVDASDWGEARQAYAAFALPRSWS
jgi:hypothetical protein